MRINLPHFFQRVRLFTVLFTVTLSLALFALDGRTHISGKHETTKIEVVASNRHVRRSLQYYRSVFKRITSFIPCSTFTLRLQFHIIKFRTTLRENLEQFLTIKKQISLPYWSIRFRNNPEHNSLFWG